MIRKTISQKNLILIIVFIFIMLSFFRLPYLDENAILSQLYIISKFVSIFLFLIIYLMDKDFTLPNYIVYAVTTQIILTLVSLYLKVPLVNLVKEIVTSISFFIIIDYFLKKYTNIFINSVFFVLFVLVMVNFAIIILYPRGIYNIGLSNRSYWLFGHVNNMPVFLYPSLLISAIVYKRNSGRRKILPGILFLVTILSILLGNSATSIMGLVFIAVFMVFRNIRINLRTTFVIAMTFFIVIVLMGGNNNFVRLIGRLFNRDITFTGRTLIWGRILQYIKRSLIFGYGIESSAITLLKFNFVSPHNRYLYTLYRGGLVSFILLILFIFSIDVRAKKFKIDKSLEGLFRFIMVASCSILILFEMESYTGSLIYFSFLILANFNYINDLIMERKAIKG